MQRARTAVCDRGQSTAVVMMTVAIVVTLMLGIGRLGATLVDRQSAGAAADATALAAISGGVSAARTVAAANGATLVAVRFVDVDTVEVVVRRGSSTVRARATRAP